MHSHLFTKKAAFITLGVLAALILGGILINIFLVKPAVIKSQTPVYVTNSGGETVTEPTLERKKTDDGYTYYIMSTDQNDLYASITAYDGKEKNIVIPSSIEGYPVKEIVSCFMNNKTAQTIEVPNSVTAIGEFTFCGCTSLKKVIIPPSVKTIGYAINGGAPDFVICGAKGSAAEEYALNADSKEHGCESPIAFEEIDIK